MKRGGSDEAKRRAGEAAAEAVTDGTVVGLGTGSTTAYAIEALGERVDEGLDIRGIPTSQQARELARQVGIPLTTLAAVEGHLDVAIDGADAVAAGQLIKGGGAAHAREKIVDTAAERLLIVVDESKLAAALDGPVPVEVLPAARTTVLAAIESLGGTGTVRAAERKDGPVVTDNGNLVVDCSFGEITDPAGLAASLSALPGVVEHGLFVDLADRIYVGTAEGVTVRDPD